MTEMNSLIPGLLLKYEEADGKWCDPPKKIQITHPDQIKSEIVDSYLLDDGNIIVALWQFFSFYTQELVHIQDVELNSLAEGLGVMTEFEDLD